MKKNIKSIAFGLLLAAFTLSFASCGYQPVFYGIMHDVEPEEATVSGNIAAIARCTVGSEEYLVLSSGGSLMYKKLLSSQHGEWTDENIVLPFVLHHYNYFSTSTEEEGHVGQQILRVIADKDYLYLLTASFKQDDEYGVVLPDTIFMWACPLSSLFSKNTAAWKNIAASKPELFPTRLENSQSQFLMDFALFYTNSPIAAHRKAYLSVTNSTDNSVSYYCLNGTSDPVKDSTIGTGSNFIKLSEKDSTVASAFYIEDSLYFSDSPAVCTNETLTENATQACLSGIDEKKDIYIFNKDDTKATKLLSAPSPVSCLAYTADSIIIGEGSYSSNYSSNGGIDRIPLDSNGNPQKAVSEDFSNNAKYQFTSSYIILTLICADPSKTEAQASLYASISYRGSNSNASFTDVGLWSYYPDRGNWNRE